MSILFLAKVAIMEALSVQWSCRNPIESYQKISQEPAPIQFFFILSISSN